MKDELDVIVQGLMFGPYATPRDYGKAIKAAIKKERIDRDLAVADFFKFGGHTADCAKWVQNPAGSYMKLDVKCNCDFEKTVRKWK